MANTTTAAAPPPNDLDAAFTRLAPTIDRLAAESAARGAALELASLRARVSSLETTLAAETERLQRALGAQTQRADDAVRARKQADRRTQETMFVALRLLSAVQWATSEDEEMRTTADDFRELAEKAKREIDALRSPVVTSVRPGARLAVAS